MKETYLCQRLRPGEIGGWIVSGFGKTTHNIKCLLIKQIKKYGPTAMIVAVQNEDKSLSFGWALYNRNRKPFTEMKEELTFQTKNGPVKKAVTRKTKVDVWKEMKELALKRAKRNLSNPELPADLNVAYLKFVERAMRFYKLITKDK